MNGEGSPPLASLSPGAPFLATLAALILAGIAVHALLASRVGPARLDAWTRRAEGLLFALILAAMLALSGLQVVLRNLFHGGLLWIDPLVRILVLWVAFIGALAATSQGRHLHVDVVFRMLSPRGVRLVGRITSAVAAVSCALLANGAYAYLREEYGYGTSPFLGVPSWAAQSILLWGFCLLAYRFLVHTIWPVPRREPGVAPLPEATEGTGAVEGQRP